MVRQPGLGRGAHDRGPRRGQGQRLDKLEVYGELGAQEVWIWRRGKLQVHALRGAGRSRSRVAKQRPRAPRYEAIARSELLPGLDVDLLVSFLDRPSMNVAIRDFTRALASSSE